MLNDDRANWGPAYALFTGDVAYVWQGALHGDVVAAELAACGSALRSLGQTASRAEPRPLSLAARKLLVTRCALSRDASGRLAAPDRAALMADEGDGRTRIPAHEDVLQRSGEARSDEPAARAVVGGTVLLSHRPPHSRHKVLA